MLNVSTEIHVYKIHLPPTSFSYAMIRTLNLFPDIEMQPDESASQIIFWNPSDNESDIHDNVVMSSNDQRSAFQVSKPQSKSIE